MQLNNMSDNMAAAVVATYPSPAHLLAVSTPPLLSLQTSDTLSLLWGMKAGSMKGSFQVSDTSILLHGIKLVVWEAPLLTVRDESWECEGLILSLWHLHLSSLIACDKAGSVRGWEEG